MQVVPVRRAGDENGHNRPQFAGFCELGAIVAGIRTLSPSPQGRRLTEGYFVCSCCAAGGRPGMERQGLRRQGPRHNDTFPNQNPARHRDRGGEARSDHNCVLRRPPAPVVGSGQARVTRSWGRVALDHNCAPARPRAPVVGSGQARVARSRGRAVAGSGSLLRPHPGPPSRDRLVLRVGIGSCARPRSPRASSRGRTVLRVGAVRRRRPACRDRPTSGPGERRQDHPAPAPRSLDASCRARPARTGPGSRSLAFYRHPLADELAFFGVWGCEEG